MHAVPTRQIPNRAAQARAGAFSEAPSAAHVLAYQVPPDAPPRRLPSRLRRGALAVTTIPAAVTPFLGFTYDVSPLRVAQDSFEELAVGRFPADYLLVALALPFFLGPIALALRLRLLTASPATRAEAWVALSLAAASACGTIAFCAYYFHDVAINGGWEVFPTVCCLMALGTLSGGAALVVVTRHHLTPDERAIGAVQTAFLANATMCLLAFSDNAQLGWWLTAVASAVIVVQGARRGSARFEIRHRLR